MDEIINKIVEKHKNIFGDNPSIEKINVGFTNLIYKINDSCIVKICINQNNESSFQKEIDFYKHNEKNDLIPKLYYSCTDKKVVPYYYEILEKVRGVSLYHVWHTLSDKEREDIIRQLCEGIKEMHSNVGDSYDWVAFNKNRFNSLFQEAKNKKMLSNEEIDLVNRAYDLFDTYLESGEFVLIHNDLHFDNILVHNGKIKIIDFERSMYAPKDFELHILYYMIQQPWKHANEECEKYTNVEDYQNIMFYIEKYYPELVGVPNLYKRLAIYDFIYELSHLVKYPDCNEELKEDVIKAAERVINIP